MKIWILALCGLALTGCFRARRGDVSLETLADWEDNRSLASGSVEAAALQAQSPSVRSRAFLVLAREQEATTAITVIMGLGDSDALVRREVAFALGELAQAWEPLPPDVVTSLTGAALQAEANEADLETKRRLLEALGKLGTPTALNRLVERIWDADVTLAKTAAVGLGVAARKGNAIPTAAFPRLAERAQAGAAPEPRWAAFYALSASKAAEAAPNLIGAANDADLEVRALAAKGLGDLPATVDTVTPLRTLLQDSNGRVSSEAARSLAKVADRCTTDVCPALPALKLLESKVERFAHGELAGGAIPILAFAQQGISTRGRPLLVGLRDKLRKAFAEAPPNLRPDLANLDCRLAVAMDKQTGKLEESLGCGAGIFPQERRLFLAFTQIAESKALKTNFDPKPVLDVLHSPSANVRSAAVSLLGSSGKPEVLGEVRAMLHDADPIVVESAAGALGELGDTASMQDILKLASQVTPEKASDQAQPFADALVALKAKEAIPLFHTWLTFPHANVRLIAAKALTTLEGHPVRVPHVDGATNVPAAAPAPKNATLKLTTSRGLIVLKLDPERAPRTSAQIWRLFKAGYFTGTNFFRIVPNFVVQGGDPRGDGEGSPGYSMRCEINDRPYHRGTLGMALAGKDTGGSQIFITQSAEPHLEGKYTAFGEVVSGMDAVDALMEGDRILEVKTEP